MHRHLPLTLTLALGIGLAACDLTLQEPDDNGGNPGTGFLIGIVARPSTPPPPGDTLTFYVTFPDSTSERVLISWRLDQRGTQLPGGCTRSVCIKWIVPAGADTYQHSVLVANPHGQSSVPFTTVVP